MRRAEDGTDPLLPIWPDGIDLTDKSLLKF